jgi:hypothetical protein
MRGRRPSGPEFVDKLSGGEKAKARLKVLLETIAGERRVLDACQQLGIGEARFDQLRLVALEAAIVALEDRPAGRPARTPNAAEEEIAQLRGRIAELEANQRVLLVRAELAAALPATKKKIPPPRTRAKKP